MKASVDNNVYLKDLVPSAPLPPLFQIEREEIEAYISQEKLRGIRAFTNNIGETYVTYGSFFGEYSPLSRVYFNLKVLGEVTNHYLYCLELWLAFNIKTYEFFPKNIFIEKVTFPIHETPPLRPVAITIA